MIGGVRVAISKFFGKRFGVLSTCKSPMLVRLASLGTRDSGLSLRGGSKLTVYGRKLASHLSAKV